MTVGTTGVKGIVHSDMWEERGLKAGARHRFRVRDSLTKRYESECFDDYNKGLAWAKGRLKEFRAGKATARSLLFADLGASYISVLEGVPATGRHIAQTRQVVDGLTKAGARSVTDPEFRVITQKWLAGLKAQRTWQKKAVTASPSLKQKFLILARAVCQSAVDHGDMPYNPLTAIRLPKVPRAMRPVFTVPELRKLVAESEDKWRWWAVVLAYTGMRPTEARFATADMFDATTGYVTVSATHPGNKSKVARRFPIQPELAAIILDMSGHLVPYAIRAMDEGNAIHGFKDYCARCGVEPGTRGPHAMRHTVASMLTATGLSPHLVMDYIGHETSSVTKHYSKNADLHREYVAGWKDHHFRLLAHHASAS